MVKLLQKLFPLLCALFFACTLIAYGSNKRVRLTLNHSIFVKKIVKHNQHKRTRLKANKNVEDPLISPTGPIILCPGSTTALSLNNVQANAAIKWWKDDAPISGQTESNLSVNSAGSYNATVDDVPSNKVVISLAQTPTAKFIFSGANNCVSSPVQFTSQSTGDNLTYSWDFGDPNSDGSNTSNAVSPSHLFVGTKGGATQSFTVKLTVTNAAGCTATQSQIVTMLQKPSALLDGVDLTDYQGEQYFTKCTPSASSITFSNASVTKATNKKYEIQWGDGSTNYVTSSFDVPLTHLYALGLYTLRLTVTGQNDCTETSVYHVFVGSNPSIGISNPGNTSICTGETLTFPITNTGNNPPGTKYTITFNDGTPPIIYGDDLPSSVSHTFNKGSCGTNSANGSTQFVNSFSAAIEASNPCGISASSAVPIYVSQKPSANFSSSATSSCTNTTLTFNNTSINGSNVSTSGVCSQGKFVWSVSPSAGVTVNSGSLGTEALSYTSSTSGSSTLGLRFSIPGIYTVQLKVFSGNAVCGTDVITKTICINPTPTASFTTDFTEGCAPLTIKASSSSSVATCGTNTYQWSISPSSGFTYINGTNANSTDPQITFNNAGNYTLTLTTFAPGGACSATVTKSITVNGKPIVNLNAGSTVCEGSTLQPKAIVTGGANSYQWTFEGGIPASSTLTVPGNVVYNTAGTYLTTLTVTNDCGSTTTTNSITVRATPVISALPDKNFCNGDVTSQITPIVNIPGSNIFWTNNNTSIGLPSSGSGSIPSFTARNLGTSAITATITVSSSQNGCAAIPQTFRVNVFPKPSAPTAQTTYTYCTGETASTLTATAGTSNTLSWYSDAQLTNKLAAAPTPVTTTAGTFRYYVTQTNSGGCESAATLITVTVNPAIAGNSISGNQTICFNTSPATLLQSGTLSGGISSYAHQWQSSVDGTNWVSITGATSPSYVPPVLTSTTHYRRIVSSGGCTSQSNPVVITVQGALNNYGIGNNETICVGNMPAKLTGETPNGGDGTFTYRWESSVNNSTWQIIANETGKDYQPGALTTTTYFRRTTTSGICSGTSNVVAITVIPQPIVNTVSSKNLCHDATSSAITFSSTSGGTVNFNWTNDNTTIGLSASGSGNIASFIAKNTGHEPQVANISVTATATQAQIACAGPPTTFTITVLPDVHLQAISPQTVCAGTTVPAITPINDAAAYPGATVSYRWSISNSTIGLLAGNGNQIPSFTAINNGITDVTATITITPVYRYNNQSCDGTPVSYTVTVSPQPSTANAGPDQRTCSNTITLSGNTPQVGTGTWTQTGGFGAIISNAASPSTTILNLLKGSRTAFTWTITNQNCSTSSDVVEIDVLNDITNTIKSSETAVCPGTAVTLQTQTLSGGDIPLLLPASYTYVWESSVNGSTGWQVLTGKNTETISVTPTANTYYRRRVSSYQQCEVISNSILVSLNSTPIAANAGANTVLCNESNYKLQGNNPGTGFTGTWAVVSGDAGLSFVPDAHTPDALITGLQPGKTYTLKWAITNGICGETSATMSLNNLAPLTNSIAVLESVTCAGIASQLTGSTPSGGTGVYQYIWQRSTDNLAWVDVAGQTAKDLSITLPETSYMRRIVKSAACVLESQSLLVTVKPAVANNTISGQAQVCTGFSPGKLQGSLPTGGDGNYTYQWQISLNGTTWTNISNAVQQDYDAAALTQTTYFRRLVQSSLCASSAVNTSNIWQVTVNPDALADFSVSITTGCAPFSLKQQIITVPHPDRNSTYEWFANGTLIGTGETFPGYTITNDGENVTIRLVTNSKFGCTTSAKEITFTTIKAVTASFTKSTAKGCGPLTVQFTNTSQPLGGGNYEWNFGNGQQSVLQQPGAITFQPHPLNRDTTYIITLKAKTACGENIFVDSVTVRPQPKAIFTPDKTIGCSPFEINITNQSRGVPNTYTFDFGNGDKIVRTDNSAFKYTYITTKTDTLTLKMVAENECGKDSSFYRIVVYPNTVQANMVVNGDNQYGCAPVTIKFDNNSVGANSFLWNFGDGNTATTSAAPETMNHTFTLPGTYVVRLVATNGCSTASTTQTITVYDQPVASFATNKSQYCVKEAVLFNNTSIKQGYTYLWSFGDGITSNATHPQHNYASPGKYMVTLTVSQSFSNGSVCSGKSIHEVEVLPSPVSTFTTNAGGLNCTPFKLITNTTPANASSVEWNFGDPAGENNEVAGYAQNHTYTKAGVYKVRAIAYSLMGCADTTYQTVRVTERPLAVFTPADTVFCGSGVVVPFFNRSTYSGNDLVTYKWLINGSTITTQKNLTYTFTPPANAVFPYLYKVTLIAYSTIGCPDTVSHTIQVNALPKANFTVDALAGCAPMQLKVNNTSGYADNYRWYLNNILISTNKEPDNLVLTQPNAVYQLKLVVGNAFGCKTDSMTRQLTTHPKPVARFTLADSASCNGKLDIQITNNSTGATSYTWNFGDGASDAAGSTPSHIYGVPGIYSLRMIAFNGLCRDTMVKTIRIAAPPKAAFTASIVKGCSQITTVFQNASANASNYLWDFGDGTFSTSKNPSHTYTYVGSPFTVKLIATGDFGCSDTTLITNYITVSAPPKADFQILPDSVIRIPDYSFRFTNKSLGNPIKYKWDLVMAKHPILQIHLILTSTRVATR